MPWSLLLGSVVIVHRLPAGKGTGTANLRENLRTPFLPEDCELRVSPFAPQTLCSRHCASEFPLHSISKHYTNGCAFLSPRLPIPPHTTSLGIFPFLQGQPFFTEETLLVGRMGTVIPPGLKPHLSGAICFFRRRRRFS